MMISHILLFNALFMLIFGSINIIDLPQEIKDEILAFNDKLTTFDWGLFLIGSCQSYQSKQMLSVNKEFNELILSCQQMIKGLRKGALKSKRLKNNPKLIELKQKLIDSSNEANVNQLKEALWINFGYYFYYVHSDEVITIHWNDEISYDGWVNGNDMFSFYAMKHILNNDIFDNTLKVEFNDFNLIDWNIKNIQNFQFINKKQFWLSIYDDVSDKEIKDVMESTEVQDIKFKTFHVYDVLVINLRDVLIGERYLDLSSIVIGNEETQEFQGLSIVVGRNFKRTILPNNIKLISFPETYDEKPLNTITKVCIEIHYNVDTNFKYEIKYKLERLAYHFGYISLRFGRFTDTIWAPDIRTNSDEWNELWDKIIPNIGESHDIQTDSNNLVDKMEYQIDIHSDDGVGIKDETDRQVEIDEEDDKDAKDQMSRVDDMDMEDEMDKDTEMDSNTFSGFESNSVFSVFLIIFIHSCMLG